jgi:hypothetical protein
VPTFEGTHFLALGFARRGRVSVRRDMRRDQGIDGERGQLACVRLALDRSGERADQRIAHFGAADHRADDFAQRLLTVAVGRRVDDRGGVAFRERAVQVRAQVVGRADVTKCNRYWSLGALRQMPLVRMIGNAGLTFLVKVASGYWNIFDPANGFVAIRTKALERLPLAKLPKRYFFESGFLIELGIQRAVVLDVPMTARYGEEHSSLKPHRVLFEFPPRLFVGFVRRLFWRYFVHDFSAVSVFTLTGLPLFVGGVSFGTWEYVTFSAHDRVATAGEVMLAAMPIILGVQLLLQAIALDVASVPKDPVSPPLRRADTGSGRTR